MKKPNHRPYKTLEQPQDLKELYYTIEETADLLKVHSNTVRNMIKDERLKAQQLGRIWRIERKEIDNLFK